MLCNQGGAPMNFLEGIEFNIMQPVGVNVVAFLVKMTKFEQWGNLPLCSTVTLSSLPIISISLPV